MICSHCQTDNRPDRRFCRTCGSELTRSMRRMRLPKRARRRILRRVRYLPGSTLPANEDPASAGDATTQGPPSDVPTVPGGRWYDRASSRLGALLRPRRLHPKREPPAGIEPATWWVEATRSVQLSYGGRCRTRQLPAADAARLIPFSRAATCSTPRPRPQPVRRGSHPASSAAVRARQICSLTSLVRPSRCETARAVCHAGAHSVAVAQQVRAPGCGPGGRGFKSPRSPQNRSDQLPREMPASGAPPTLADLQPSRDRAVDSFRASSSTAEQRTLNPQVSGSNPEGRTVTEGRTSQVRACSVNAVTSVLTSS